MHVQYQQQALGHGRNGEHGSSTSSMHCTGLWSKEHTGHGSRSVAQSRSRAHRHPSRHTVTIAAAWSWSRQHRSHIGTEQVMWGCRGGTPRRVF